MSTGRAQHAAHAAIGAIPVAGIGLIELAGTGALGPVALGVGGLAAVGLATRGVRHHRPGRGAAGRRSGGLSSRVAGQRRVRTAAAGAGGSGRRARRATSHGAAGSLTRRGKATTVASSVGTATRTGRGTHRPGVGSAASGRRSTGGGLGVTGNRATRRAAAKAARKTTRAHSATTGTAQRRWFGLRGAADPGRSARKTATKVARRNSSRKLRKTGSRVLRKIVRTATFRKPGARRRFVRVLHRMGQCFRAVGLWIAGLAAVGTLAWCWIGARVGNGVRSINRASLAFLGVPFEGLGADLRRFLRHLTGNHGTAVVLPTVLTRPTAGATAPEGVTVTTNLRQLIDAVHSTPGIGEKPHALTVEQWHKDVAELAAAIGALLHRDADHVAETLPVSGSAHEITGTIGSAFSQLGDTMGDLTEEWQRANGTRLERLHSEESGEELWDHSTRPDR